mgnify:CR=1 FL=1
MFKIILLGSVGIVLTNAFSLTPSMIMRKPADTKVLVAGATGYIGKFVVQELVRREFGKVGCYPVVGYDVPKNRVGCCSHTEEGAWVGHLF